MYGLFQTDPQTDCFRVTRLAGWVLLAVALLLYGMMVLGQVGLRFVSPGLFDWGSRFLPSIHGFASTVALIVSCVPIVIARRIEAKTNRWLMIAALSVAFLGGIVFLAIQSVEYENIGRNGLGWITSVSNSGSGPDGVVGELNAGDAAGGQMLWQATCLSCHGTVGQGVEGQGKDLRQSLFVHGLDDLGLMAFIKTGRAISDPLNTTGKAMPPKGGNPLLKDQQLMDLVAYIRTIQVPISGAQDPDAEEIQPLPDEDIPPVIVDDEETIGVEENAPEQEGFWIARSSLPLANLGPEGLSSVAFERTSRPARAEFFFGFFFLMTGVHALQVIIGLAILAWLIYRAVQIQYHPSHAVPVNLACYYWGFTTAIWGILFSLFYLIV